MLRRTQSIQLKPDEDYDQGIEVEEITLGSLASGRSDRRNVEQWLTEVQRATETPKSDKRGLDALRAEFQRTVVSNGDSTPDGASIGSFWRNLMKPSRLLLLLVAVIAAAAAMYVALQEAPPPIPAPEAVVETPPAVQVVEEPRVPVLVAGRPIAIGERLTAATVEWAPWPEAVARPEFIVEAPDALEQIEGAVARQEFLAGEPIRLDKLSEGEGYLSAILPEGSRAVAVSVSPETGSGGFIQPNDHVDVVLTRSGATGGVQMSATILADVRVLAIGNRLGRTAPTTEGEAEAAGPETAQGFEQQTIATLALAPREAETLASAANMGRLSLVLRPLSENGRGGETSTGLSRNDQIRMTSPFWAN